MMLTTQLTPGSEAVVERMREVTVDRRWRKKIGGLTASDHAPVWVDLQ